MSTFLAAVRAEFTKLLTTRLWWVLAIVLFGYIALLSGGLSALFGALTTGHLPTRGGALPHFGALAPLIYSFATSVGYVFPVLLGALVTAGEIRHQTITPTLLATPKRITVLGAKGISALVAGAGYGVIALVASVGAGAIGLGAFGIDNALGASDTWALFGRALIAMALWGAIGIALGVLIPNQTAAIVVILAFTQFVEPLLRFAGTLSEPTSQIARFLPGAAGDALVGSSFFTVETPTAASPLDWWAGGLVLLGYAVVFGVAGYWTSWRRDVT